MNNIDLYIVEKGDTLYNIAKKHNITWQKLMQVNNKKNTLLRIGEQLIVPGQTNKINYYVQEGDTLYNIAQKFRMDIDTLRQLNDLNTDDVLLGQLLIIKE